MRKIVLPFLAALLAAGFSIPGGFFDVDVNDQGVQNALNCFIVHHNNGTDDTNLYKVAEVNEVKVQVVAGLMYRVNVTMARTSCRKDNVTNEECVFETDPELAKSYQCTFSVWSRPWLNETKLVKHQC